MLEAFRLLIGSMGDDSHSVGMSLLEIAFREAGFFVKNIGIMNVLEDFFFQAENFDAIFICCMNGHVDLYLKNFAAELKRFDSKNRNAKVWYLGGNLSVQEEYESLIRRYRSMGFDFVAPKPISFEIIIKKLLKDFYKKGIKKKRVNHLKPEETICIASVDFSDDFPMRDEVFISERQKVLDSWPSGQGVWDTDIKKNHANTSKNFHNLLVNPRSNNGNPLVQPRTGVAHTCDEIELLIFLGENGLDISSIDNPFQIRAGSSDHSLVYEIGLAGGATSLEGGFICYLYPYDKNTSPVESLPFDEDIIDFHKEKIHQRMTRQRAFKIFEILEKDLIRIWKNDYIRWPLDGHYVN